MRGRRKEGGWRKGSTTRGVAKAPRLVRTMCGGGDTHFQNQLQASAAAAPSGHARRAGQNLEVQKLKICGAEKEE